MITILLFFNIIEFQNSNHQEWLLRWINFLTCYNIKYWMFGCFFPSLWLSLLLLFSLYVFISFIQSVTLFSIFSFVHFTRNGLVLMDLNGLNTDSLFGAYLFYSFFFCMFYKYPAKKCRLKWKGSFRKILTNEKNAQYRPAGYST